MTNNVRSYFTVIVSPKRQLFITYMGGNCFKSTNLTVKDYKFHPSCLAFYWKVIEYMQNKTWKLNWAIFSISWSIVHKTFLRKQNNWSKLKSEVWGLENSDIALGGAYSLSFSLEENCCLLLEILKYSSGYWYLKQMNCAWYQTTTSKVMCCSPAVIRID